MRIRKEAQSQVRTMYDQSVFAMALFLSWGAMSFALTAILWGFAGYTAFRLTGASDKRWWVGALILSAVYIGWDRVLPDFMGPLGLARYEKRSLGELLGGDWLTLGIADLVECSVTMFIGFVVGRWALRRFEKRVRASVETEMNDSRLNRMVKWMAALFCVFLSLPFLFPSLQAKLQRPDVPKKIASIHRNNLPGDKPIRSIYVFKDNEYAGMGGLVEKNGNRIILTAAHVFSDHIADYTFTSPDWTTKGAIRVAINLDDALGDLAIAFPDTDEFHIETSDGGMGKAETEVMDGPSVRSVHSEEEDQITRITRGVCPRATCHYMIHRTLAEGGGDSGEIYLGEQNEIYVLTARRKGGTSPDISGSGILNGFPFTVPELDQLLSRSNEEFRREVSRLVKWNAGELGSGETLLEIFRDRPGLNVLGMLIPQQAYLDCLKFCADTARETDFIRIYGLGIRVGVLNTSVTALLLKQLDSKDNMNGRRIARSMAATDEAHLLVGDRWHSSESIFGCLKNDGATTLTLMSDYVLGFAEAVRGKPRSLAIMVGLIHAFSPPAAQDGLAGLLIQERLNKPRDPEYYSSSIALGNHCYDRREWPQIASYYGEYLEYFEKLPAPVTVGDGNHNLIMSAMPPRLLEAHVRLGNHAEAARLCTLVNRERAKTASPTLVERAQEGLLHARAGVKGASNPVNHSLFKTFPLQQDDPVRREAWMEFTYLILSAGAA